MRSKVLPFLMLATISFAFPARAAAPDEKQKEEARTHFEAGVNLLQDPARPRYEEAYLEFKKAYSLAGSPTILGNLGLCAMKLERDQEAIDAFTRYLQEVPDLPAEERAQVERDLSTLRTTVASVHVETQPAGATIVDERVPVSGATITNVYGPIEAATTIGVRQGHHVFKARFPSGREAAWESDVKGGEGHVFEEPPEDTLKDAQRGERGARPIPKAAFVTGGLALALGAGALVTGVVALDRHSDFETKNDGSNPGAADDVRGTGKTLNIVTDGLLLGAIVAAGVTTYLVLTRPTVSKPPTAASSPFSFRF